jgi:hypothetical protein
MRIGTLYATAPSDVYVIGTGPSLRCLDLSYFADKFTIGLNQAWKHLATTYAITVHPELLPEYNSTPGHRTKWIIKKKPPMAHLQLDDENYFVFLTSPDLETVVTRPPDTLYLGEGIQTTAIDMAARMGAKNVILVGCDANQLLGDFHAHDQHVRWLGLKPDEQYALYRKRTAQVRWKLRDLGVNVMTLTPFIGTDAGVEDYTRIRVELGFKALPRPKDVSPYKRKRPKR